MEKVVVKTAVKTVLIILGIVGIIFAVFNFAFPQHMATLTEGMGNYSLAIKYASLRYSYTHDGEDLARCFDDAVLLGEDKYILEFGEDLVKLKDFDVICEKKSDEIGGGYDYHHYVLNKISLSYYNTGKKAEAVALALEANGGSTFVYGNALMSLAARVRSANDAQTSKMLVEILQNIHPENQTEADNLQVVINGLNAVISESKINSN